MASGLAIRSCKEVSIAAMMVHPLGHVDADPMLADSPWRTLELERFHMLACRAVLLTLRDPDNIAVEICCLKAESG